jgi:ribosomal protein L27/ribosomal protein L21
MLLLLNREIRWIAFPAKN